MAKAIRFSQELIDEYMAKGYWESITYSDLWDRNARDYPEKEAIVDSKARLTWSEAKQKADRIAFGLIELGIERDKVIITQLPSCVELLLFRMACEKAGIINLFAQSNLRHKEMEYLLKHSEAVGIVTSFKFRDFNYFEMIQEISPNLPDLKHIFITGNEVPQGAISVAEMTEQPLEQKYTPELFQQRKFEATEILWISTTTGTTGFPKLVEYATCHRMCASKGRMGRLNFSHDDVIGALSPVDGAGRQAYFGTPLMGAKSVVMERFDAEQALKLIEKERITIALAVPAQLAMMLQQPNPESYDLSSLRTIYCGGSPVSYQLAKEAEEKFRCRVTILYGGVDAGAISSTSIDDPDEIRLLTVGKPLPGNEVKLLDESGREVSNGEAGEVAVRGACCVHGFYKDPEATKQAWSDGWFRMGDLGRLDEHGNLLIVGRKKDIIIRGGQNIYPAEIESMLLTHPKISNVAIVSMPDPVMGEKACAYVVPKPGEQFTFDEIISFLKERNIAPYKLPERLEVIDRLPLVADQKPDKKALRQDIATKLQAEGKA